MCTGQPDVSEGEENNLRLHKLYPINFKTSCICKCYYNQILSYLLFGRSNESRIPVEVEGWSLDDISNVSTSGRKWVPRISTSESSSVEELRTIISCPYRLVFVSTISSESESKIIVSLWAYAFGIGIAEGTGIGSYSSD